MYVELTSEFLALHVALPRAIRAVTWAIARVLGEEALFMDGPPGYPEYAAKVLFRLLPGGLAISRACDAP